MSEVVQFLWFGIVQGSIIATGAVGFTLIFGVMNFFNITYAEYIIITPYIMLWAAGTISNSLVGVLLGVLVTILVAVALDRGVFKLFRDRDPFTLLIVAIGLSFILRSVVRMIWGAQSQLFQIGFPGAFQPGNILIQYTSIAILGITLAVLIVLSIILTKTDIGIAMRASSENKDLTMIRGINPEHVMLYVTIIAGAIAGITGVLITMNSSVSPITGFVILIPIIAASIVGGVGDPRGAVIAGLGIGIIQELSVLVISASYKPAVALLIVIIGIAFKPEGLFGTATRV